MNSNARVIADAQKNSFVRNGVSKHSATKVAPQSFFEPFPAQTESALLERQCDVERQLKKKLGKPFFTGPGFILYQADCVNGLQGITETSVGFQLTITSPPYNIGKEYEEISELSDYVAWCVEWMRLIHESTEENGAFWLNVGYLEVPEKGQCVPIPYLLWDKSPFYLLQEVVWHYGAGVSTSKRLCPRNEKWLYYVKDSNAYVFNLDAIRDPNVKYPNQKKNGKFRCNPLGKNPSDVWNFPKVTTGSNRSSKERTDHPAQFPLPVVERVIKASSNPVDIVLDPFSGSGSAGLAASALGRIYVGFELRKDYCEMTAERMEEFWSVRDAEISQARLF